MPEKLERRNVSIPPSDIILLQTIGKKDGKPNLSRGIRILCNKYRKVDYIGGRKPKIVP